MSLLELLEIIPALSLHLAPSKEKSTGIIYLRIALRESLSGACSFDHYLKQFKENSDANRPLGLRCPKDMVGFRTYDDRVEVFRIYAGGEIKDIFAVVTHSDVELINFAHYKPLTFFDHFKGWQDAKQDKSLVRAGNAATKAKIIERPNETGRAFGFWQRIVEHRSYAEKDAWIFRADGYSLLIQRFQESYQYQVKPNRYKLWSRVTAGFSSLGDAYDAGTSNICNRLKKARARIGVQLKLFSL